MRNASRARSEAHKPNVRRMAVKEENGVLYRVVDPPESGGTIWGDGDGKGLTFADATKLKESVVTTRQSRSAMVEPMPMDGGEPYEDIEVEGDGEVGELTAHHLGSATMMRDQSVPVARMPRTQPVPVPASKGAQYEVAVSDTDITIPAAGVVQRVIAGHELIVDGVQQPVPVSVPAGAVVRARPLDAALAEARAAATSAAAQVAAAAQARAQARAREPYRDRTVKTPTPRAAPAPRDKTASRGVYIRLGTAPVAPPAPPPSPLKVATQLDGQPLPDGALTDMDLPDLAGDLGGGPTEADLEHARNLREQGA